MKRWWWILAAIALFFVGDRLGAMLLDQLLARSPQRFSRLYAGNLAGEIVCLGNSRGVVDMHAPSIAKATGKSTVNISHNGMTAQIGQAIFEDYLEFNPQPKIAVIEVSFITSETTGGGVAEYMPFWSRSLPLRALAKTYSPKELIAGDVTHLYRFNSELFLRSMIYLLSGKGDQGAGMNATLSSALLEETSRMAPFKLDVREKEVEALRGVVEAAREANVEVRLVLAPYLPTYAEKITDLDEIVALLTEKTGAKVFDFSRAVRDENLFADRVHMNPAGSGEFVRLMVEAGVFAPATETTSPNASQPAVSEAPEPALSLEPLSSEAACLIAAFDRPL